jgi:hypothetical protein
MQHEWGEEECMQDIGGKATSKETTKKMIVRWIDRMGWYGLD